jgi:hypothetical protein
VKLCFKKTILDKTSIKTSMCGSRASGKHCSPVELGSKRMKWYEVRVWYFEPNYLNNRDIKQRDEL